MTSYGLFHQPAGTRATSSRNASKAVTAGRDVSASSDATKPHRPTGDATSASAAPAFEAPVDDDSSNAAVHRHSSNLLERHTSAAKDGVIDMLTTKASKLGVSLERALLAKKEAEDSADRQQVQNWQHFFSTTFSHKAIYLHDTSFVCKAHLHGRHVCDMLMTIEK